MLPKTHIILGFFYSLLIYALYPKITLTGAFIVFLASFLIDVDHYLIYVYKKKSCNLNKAFKWFKSQQENWGRLPEKERKNYKEQILLFHGVEFVLLLTFLSIFSELFKYILIGILFHLALDFVDLKIKKRPFRQKSSQLYIAILNKNKKLKS